MRERTMNHVFGAQKRRRLTAYASVLCALALLGAGTTQSWASAPPPVTPVPTPLRVGIAPVQPPLAFKEHNVLAGVEVDFARRLEPALGVKVTFVEVPDNDLVTALRERRIDVVMSGMAITPERQKVVRFTLPYLRIGEVLLLRKADVKRLPGLEAMNRSDVRIGFLSGSSGEVYVQSKLPRAQAKGFGTADAAVKALQERGIDVFIAKAPVIWGLTVSRHDPQHHLVARYRPLTEDYLAWAVRPDDAGLLGKLNGTLRRWEADGTLRDVLDDWIHISPAGRRR
jgi:ABC-type amino acid transport substrate-binding protein